MNSWRNLVPAPLAAPETRALKAARLRTMTGLFLVAALVVSFGALRALSGIFALALFAGATTFALLQGFLWVRAKNAADDAWLMRERDDAL